MCTNIINESKINSVTGDILRRHNWMHFAIDYIVPQADLSIFCFNKLQVLRGTGPQIKVEHVFFRCFNIINSALSVKLKIDIDIFGSQSVLDFLIKKKERKKKERKKKRSLIKKRLAY